MSEKHEKGTLANRFFSLSFKKLLFTLILVYMLSLITSIISFIVHIMYILSRF